LFAENGLVSWLLNILYLLSLILATPWLLWRICWQGKNRSGWNEKFFGSVPPRQSPDPCIWLHAVSVGEVNLLQPLVVHLREILPEFELVISTTTDTGYQLARKKFPELLICRFPFDFSWAVRNALRRIRPSVILMTELEIWPNWIRLSQGGIGQQYPPARLGVINGRLSEGSLRGYRRWGWLFRGIFSRLDLVCVQDPVYAQRFIDLGCQASRVKVTGNIKYDGVTVDRANPRTQALRQLLPFPADARIFLAGSTQENEDFLAAEVYRNLHPRYPQLRLILVPRHPERSVQLRQSLQEKGFRVLNRSAWLQPEEQAAVAETGEHELPAIVLVDVIGELSAWWGVAGVAYVGGSMGKRGGQSMIEPAAYGLPVSFGPNTRNFRTDVQRLLSVEGAVVVADQAELQSFVEKSLADSDWASRLGAQARQEILSHQGAAELTARLVEQLIREQAPLNGSMAQGLDGAILD
jgi:3-deoxy-D-manno-octulosonic-acid transferase